MDIADRLDLILSVAALIGIIYKISDVVSELKQNINTVKNHGDDRADRIESQLEYKLAENKHGLELLIKDFEAYKKHQAYLLTHLNNEVGKLDKRTQHKLNDIYGFLKKMGFYDRPTLIDGDDRKPFDE